MCSLVGIPRRTARHLRLWFGHRSPRLLLLAALLMLAAGSVALAAGPAYEDSPISTIAGMAGQFGYSGDGGPATQAKLNLPYHVAVAADGTYYIVDMMNCRIRRVDTSDTITTFAGGGTPPDGIGDGLPATQAWIDYPEGAVLGPDNALYVADAGWGRIRRVDLGGDNIITTVAGGGDPPDGVGDGGPANQAWLDYPTALAFDADGNLYISDGFGARVRRVEAWGVANGSGTISTYAGTGVEGFLGDGGPAASAQLNLPVGLAFDALGRLYIADSDNNRIRRVDVDYDHTITTIAGTGDPGYNGDDQPATSAWLYWPNHLATDTYSNLYIADYGNNRIRRVDISGIITTVAGNGTAGYAGDGGAASLAAVNAPTGVTIAPDEKMYIADMANSVIRLVTPTSNQLPTCDITFTPSTPAWGDTVNFDANSYDPDGTVETVAWDFGDGQTGSGETPSHVYVEPGGYTVGCTVTDNQGGVGSCETTVTVSPQLAPMSRTFTAGELGWNLISLPLPPDDPDPLAVFANYDPVGRLYRYDACRGTYVGLWPGDPDGFGDMDEHNGYWLNVQEEFTLSYMGIRYPPDDVHHSLDLCGNPWSWLLIGSGMESSVSLSTNASVCQNGGNPIPLCDDEPGTPDAHHEGWVVLPLYGWSTDIGSYVSVSAVGGPAGEGTTLDPWQGYWVDVEEAGLTLILTPP